MISIQSSLTELERSHQIRAAVLDCYVLAIRNAAHYAVELDEELTGSHRKYLETLATEVASGTPETLAESGATLRGLLRDYRDKAAGYLGNLRDELVGTARTLEEILDSLGQADGDHETNLRTALGKLRQVAAAPGYAALGTVISTSADSIERRFATREELSERIRSSQAGQFCLLLVGSRGLRRAEVQFGKEVAEELSGAFAKRLRNSLPVSAVIGRWGAEEFVAILIAKKAEAMASAKWITEHLSGAYACLKDGKTVRPVIQLTVGVVDTASHDTPERIIERVGAFLVGRG
jgi:GGDEF domain-containing protein